MLRFKGDIHFDETETRKNSRIAFGRHVQIAGEYLPLFYIYMRLIFKVSFHSKCQRQRLND